MPEQTCLCVSVNVCQSPSLLGNVPAATKNCTVRRFLCSPRRVDGNWAISSSQNSLLLRYPFQSSLESPILGFRLSSLQSGTSHKNSARFPPQPNVPDIRCAQRPVSSRRSRLLTGTNVAFRKPANQSTTVRGGPASNGNDGERTTVHEGKRCTETMKEASPWWMVDLLRPYPVGVVRVTTRGCCGNISHSWPRNPDKNA
jgi:hypothetical protein